MTDKEFDVLDELYFVQSFDTVLKETELAENDLNEVLTEQEARDPATNEYVADGDLPWID